MNYSEEIAKKLNELLEKNYDTEKAYRFGAENVKDSRLKSFFEERAMERYDFGHELKAEIRNFGESPDKGSSVNGDIQRSWMNLKTKLSLDNKDAILEEVVKGERKTVEEYNEVLSDTNIPASTANVVMKQRNAITAALNKVKSLAEGEYGNQI